MIKLKINGKSIAAREGSTILEAARENEIHIPTLCHLAGCGPDSSCRVCVAEVAGAPRLMPACSTLASEGMEVLTHSEKVMESRRITLDLICRHHRMDCEYCSRYSSCELHSLLRELGMDDRIYANVYHRQEKDRSSPAIIRDSSKCVLCRRCEKLCEKQGIHAIGALNRAAETKIGSIVPMPESGCIGCGQCLAVCPTGALSIKDEAKALRIAQNRGKTVIFALSPHIENAGKLVSILHQMGIRMVLDGSGFIAMAAEEVKSELAIGKKGISPICPSAAKLVDARVLGRHPEAIFHEWCRGEYGNNIFTVWVSPCTALKAGHKCDYAMTEVELYDHILRSCVSRYTIRQVWSDAVAEPFDPSVPASMLCDELSAALGGHRTLSAAGAAGIKKSNEDYDFADFLVCPGGCKNGGGRLLRRK